jgi:antitoxin MazE
MKVFKCGNDLCLELPASVIAALELKEGDEIDLDLVRPRVLEASRKYSPPEPVQEQFK